MIVKALPLLFVATIGVVCSWAAADQTESTAGVPTSAVTSLPPGPLSADVESAIQASLTEAPDAPTPFVGDSSGPQPNAEDVAPEPLPAAAGEPREAQFPPAVSAAPVVVQAHPADVQAPATSPYPVVQTVVLIDCSESMNWHLGAAGAKLHLAQWGAFEILDALPDGSPLGVYVTRHSAFELRRLMPLDWNQMTALRQSIMSLRGSGVSSMAEAIRQIDESVSDMNRSSETPVSLNLVLLTDGEKCDIPAAADAIRSMGKNHDLRLTIVGFTIDPAVISALRHMSQEGGGTYATVEAIRQISPALTYAIDPFAQLRERQREEEAGLRDDLVAARELNGRLNSDLGSARSHIGSLHRANANLSAHLRSCYSALLCCRAEKASLEEQVAGLHGALASCRAEKEAVTQELAICCDRAAGLEQALAASQSEREVISKELAICCERVAGLQNALANCQSEKEALANELAICCDRVATLQTALAACQSEKEAVSNELAICRERAAGLQSRNEEQAGRIADLTAHLDLCHLKLGCCEKESGELDARLSAEIERLQAELTKTKTDLTTTRRERDQAQERVRRDQVTIEGLEEQVATLEAQVTDLDTELGQERTLHTATKDRLSQLQAEHYALEARAHGMEIAIVRMTGENSALNRQAGEGLATALGATREMAAAALAHHHHGHHGDDDAIIAPTNFQAPSANTPQQAPNVPQQAPNTPQQAPNVPQHGANVPQQATPPVTQGGQQSSPDQSDDQESPTNANDQSDDQTDDLSDDQASPSNANDQSDDQTDDLSDDQAAPNNANDQSDDQSDDMSDDQAAPNNANDQSDDQNDDLADPNNANDQADAANAAGGGGGGGGAGGSGGSGGGGGLPGLGDFIPSG